MSQQRWSAVDDYFSDRLVPADPVLQAALDDSAAAGLPPISVSPTQGRLLYLLALMQGARSILEIGTLGGYSTIWLARALATGGRLITLESEARHAEVARTNLARAGLADTVEVRLGPAAETLPTLTTDAPFDLIFIDADKQGYPGYLRACRDLVRVGSVIIADNVVRDGAVIDPDDQDPKVAGVREFTELLAAEPRLSATAIQTVGSKGYDGFALAVVTSAAQA